MLDRARGSHSFTNYIAVKHISKSLTASEARSCSTAEKPTWQTLSTSFLPAPAVLLLRRSWPTLLRWVIHIYSSPVLGPAATVQPYLTSLLTLMVYSKATSSRPASALKSKRNRSSHCTPRGRASLPSPTSPTWLRRVSSTTCLPRRSSPSIT